MTAAASAAPSRAEINFRNAQSSTGPRSASGKQRIKFNALKHGMRAKTIVLPGEDRASFNARLDAWMIDLAPRDELDRFLVTRAVEVSWKLDRIRQLLEQRRALAGHDHADRLAAEAEEVVAAGRRLFFDPVGPLCLYPHAPTPAGGEPQRVSWSANPDDPDDPARIVVRLEALMLGCAWLLERWGELRELLECGLMWQPHDRLKAVRMLGRQPLDAPDDRRVMLIYLCGWAMDPNDQYGFSDMVNEMGPGERKVFVERLNNREAMAAAPPDEEAARTMLLALIAEEEERLEGILAQHLEREEAEAAASLAFDASPEGDRLRRYEADNERTLLRIIEALRKRHQAADRPASSRARATMRAGDPPSEIAGGVDVSSNDVAQEEIPIHTEPTPPAPQPSAVIPARDEPNRPPVAEAVPSPARTEARPPGDPDRGSVNVTPIATAATLSMNPALPAPTDPTTAPVTPVRALAGALLALFALLFLAGRPATAGSSGRLPAANPVPPTGRTVDRAFGRVPTSSSWLRSSRTPGEAAPVVRGARGT